MGRAAFEGRVLFMRLRRGCMWRGEAAREGVVEV